MGQRLYLRLNVARVCLRCIRYRHVRQSHCWLEGITLKKTDFVLDALEQALYARRPNDNGKLTHHSDSQKIEASLPDV